MSGRGALFLAAAALAAVSLALPLWGFRMSAPQYPDEALHLRVTRSGIEGDVHEINMLQKYIGVRFPREIPELRWIAPAVGALALLLAAAGLAGASRSGRLWRRAAAGLLLLFLAASAGLLQKRLYQVGHGRDPHAPIHAVRDFTPPAVGPIRVGNFTVWSYPHAGGGALAVAALLALLGSRSREKRLVGSSYGFRQPSTRSGGAAA